MIIRKFRKKRKKRKKGSNEEYMHEEEEKYIPEDYYPDIRPDEKAVEIYYNFMFGDE